jgi:hypothetical protein
MEDAMMIERSLAALIAAAAMMLLANGAHADGRTVMFVKGIAYGIAEHCPDLQVDAQAVRKTTSVPGSRPGDFYDFMDGMIYISGLLTSQQESCRSVCDIRPGTCYFVKDNEKATTRQ